MAELTCFKAYDVRGRLGDELNSDVVYRIGRAFAKYLAAKVVVIGGDIRLSTPELKNALTEGLTDEGCDVIDIGLVGTEEIYFATSYLKVDGGIVVTASHNPKDFNGLKFVREGSKPISGDTGLFKIKELAERNEFTLSEHKGKRKIIDNSASYVTHLLTYVDLAKLKPMKIVVNAGNGAAGHVIDALEQHFINEDVKVEFVKIQHKPDGNFPNGIPNPLLPDNRKATSDAIISSSANLGIAWDGDFDRCFLFDEKGDFIEGYYIVGLLAESFLKKHPHEKIIHDPRLTLNTIDIVEKNKGIAVQSKTGHAFIKERMRAENAIYGGEMSAHHYFRDFNFCDSGMIPWLLVAELMSQSERSLSSMVSKRIKKYPSSGEINKIVLNPHILIEEIETKYLKQAISVEKIDGLSMNFDGWRFNIRESNTEALLRLNVESIDDQELMEVKTKEILNMIESFKS